jgi:hypothetical protein
MASPFDINVRDWPHSARGDGITDDTEAFRSALREAIARSRPSASPEGLRPGLGRFLRWPFGFRPPVGTLPGARIYVPPGKYVLFSDPRQRERPLRFEASNITLLGDGPQSTLHIAPPWKQMSLVEDRPDSHAYFEIGRRDGEPIENVHIRDLRIQSDKTLYNQSTRRWFDPALPYEPSQVFMMGVPGTPTGVVSNSGYSGILAENLAGVVFGFNGGGNRNEDRQSRNNFVTHNRVVDCVLQAVNPASGGHAGTLVAHNVIDGNAGLAIEWSNSFALITNNVIRRARGGAFAFDNGQNPGQDEPEYDGGVYSVDGWIVFAQNTILECGEGFGGEVSPSIYGEPASYRRVLIANNAIQRAYGGGIVLAGADGSSEVVIHGNVIDGFGIDGKLLVDGRPRTTARAWAGIHAVGKRRVVVTANVVRAGTGTHDRSEYGIVTGGGIAEDCWTDGNATIGVRDGQPAFPRGAIQQNDWRTASPWTGVRVRTGRSVNLEDGQPAAKLDQDNNPHIPILEPAVTEPSVAGSATWRLYQTPPPTGSPRWQVTGLRDGFPGQIVTLVFYDDRTRVVSGSSLRLAGGQHFDSLAGSTLVLLCDYVDKPPTGYQVLTDPRWPPDRPLPDPPPPPLAFGESVIPVWANLPEDPGTVFTPPIGVGDTVSFTGQTRTYTVLAATLGPTGGSLTIDPVLQATAAHGELITFAPRSNWVELSRSGDQRA